MSKKSRKISEEEAKKLIHEDEDFIYSPKYSNSLDEFLKKHDEGVDTSLASRLLLLTEEEVEDIYSEAVESLRDHLGVEDE